MKTRIRKNIFLTVLIFCAVAFFYTGVSAQSIVEPGSHDNASSSKSSTTGWDPNSLSVFGLSNAHVRDIVKAVLYWILGIFSTIAVIAFSISGIQYVTAAGNESTMETAKKNMLYSIIGVIVGLSGLVIVFAITRALAGATYF